MSAPTYKQLAGGQIRSLRSMRKKLLNMAAQWDDVDQFCMNQLEALADQVEKTAMDLKGDDHDNQ